MSKLENTLSEPIFGWDRYRRAVNLLQQENRPCTREEILKVMTLGDPKDIASLENKQLLMHLPPELWTEQDRIFAEGNWEDLEMPIDLESEYNLGIWD